MASLTVYSSAADGRLEREQEATYALAHDEATAEVVNTTAQYLEVGQYFSVANGYNVSRGGLFFDTSALPNGCAIISATLTLTIASSYTGVAFDLTLVSGADFGASLVAGDFGDLLDDITSYGAVSTTGWSIDTAADITINAAGLATISKTGVTKWGLRSSRDISDTTPKLNGESSYNEEIQVWTSEEAESGDGSYRPKLVITYTDFIPQVMIF